MMLGKKIVINDYKFAYEKEPKYLNVYGAFMLSKKQCYIIYSYDNKKLYYGNLYIKNKMGTIMINEENDNVIREFITCLLNNTAANNYQIIDLNYIDSIQIIYNENNDLPNYRVANMGANFYPWQKGSHLGDGYGGYAGWIGYYIERIQISP